MLKQTFLLISLITISGCATQKSDNPGQNPDDSVPPVLYNLDSSTSWLDSETGLWQGSGNASIPVAPAAEDKSSYEDRCKMSRIEPSTDIEREVTDAGWTIIAETENHGAVSSVIGATDADGMCRPWNYQIFVFVNKQFAGTVSPAPMQSRIDGSAWGVEVNDQNGTPSELTVKYNRYTEDDPLCCPSAESIVKFNIVTENGRARIVPAEVVTQPTEGVTFPPKPVQY